MRVMPDVAIEIRSQSDLRGLSAMSFSGWSTATLARGEPSSAQYMFQKVSSPWITISASIKKSAAACVAEYECTKRFHELFLPRSLTSITRHETEAATGSVLILSKNRRAIAAV